VRHIIPTTGSVVVALIVTVASGDAQSPPSRMVAEVRKDIEFWIGSWAETPPNVVGREVPLDVLKTWYSQVGRWPESTPSKSLHLELIDQSISFSRCVSAPRSEDCFLAWVRYYALPVSSVEAVMSTGRRMRAEAAEALTSLPPEGAVAKSQGSDHTVRKMLAELRRLAQFTLGPTTGKISIELADSLSTLAHYRVDGDSARIILRRSVLAGSPHRLRLLLAHEGWLGHHAVAVEGRPGRVDQLIAGLGFPGFHEGWATFAEEIPLAHGGLRSSGYERVFWAHRWRLAALMEVDAGVNGSGWTPEAAADSLVSVLGMSTEGASRLVAQIRKRPGRSTAYACASMFFRALVAQEVGAAPPETSRAEIFRRILESGPLPLTMVWKSLTGRNLVPGDSCQDFGGH